jgi:hypothetical protein
VVAVAAALVQLLRPIVREPAVAAVVDQVGAMLLMPREAQGFLRAFWAEAAMVVTDQQTPTEIIETAAAEEVPVVTPEAVPVSRAAAVLLEFFCPPGHLLPRLDRLALMVVVGVVEKLASPDPPVVVVPVVVVLVVETVLTPQPRLVTLL